MLAFVIVGYCLLQTVAPNVFREFASARGANGDLAMTTTNSRRDAPSNDALAFRIRAHALGNKNAKNPLIVNESRVGAAIDADNDLPRNEQPGSRPTPPLLTAPFSADQAASAQTTWANELGRQVRSTNSIGMAVVLIPSGEFEMGSPTREKGRGLDETRHPVRLTRPYLIGRTEVTQKEWQSVMGSEPWWTRIEYDAQRTGTNAASNISWMDAVRFCNQLSTSENKPPYYEINGNDVGVLGGLGYRLPTEAEWEYACRAGTDSPFSFGSNDAELGEYAWHDGNAKELDDFYPHVAGQKRPNAFGLVDMHGNVSEWCWDWHAVFSNQLAIDPLGPAAGKTRVCRGGSWSDNWENCRSADRSGLEPNYTGRSSTSLGFRIALSLVE
jgi:formylglycine-generating enzyme required for sulfatase activity